jgi:hypothetical protein
MDDLGPVKLDRLEGFWAKHQKWFEGCGYMLRPRYMPDWTPSWLATDKHGKVVERDSWLSCEDSRSLTVSGIRHFDSAINLTTRIYVSLETRSGMQHAFLTAHLSLSNLSSHLCTHMRPRSAPFCRLRLSHQIRATTAIQSTRF